MNELKLKQAKRIGVKWGTFTFLIALSIGVIISLLGSNLSNTYVVLTKTSFLIGLLFSFVLSIIAGVDIAKQIVKGAKKNVLSWVGYGFASFIVGVMVMVGVEAWIADTLGLETIAFGFLYLMMVLFIYAIPIVLICIISGRAFNKEVLKVLNNKES